MLLNSTPEELGISSKTVLKFISELEKYKINIHSFSLSVGNKVISEAYWKPFHKDFQHRLYSVGKTVVGLAIAILEDEGKLSFDDEICKYFLDITPPNISSYTKRLTIKDMLKMRTSHHSTNRVRYDGDNLVELFFSTAPTNPPNSFFSYDTSSTHVLGALVEKLTGQKLMDYMRLKVFDDLKISKDAQFLLDKSGTSLGGSGLIATMDDFRKIAYLILKRGKINNKQYIPEDFLLEATSKLSSTQLQPYFDEQFGYGYQIWRTREDGFALYGLGGQLALCVPKYDLMLVTTADTQGDPLGTPTIHRCFWDIILPEIKRTSGEPIKSDSDGYSLLLEALQSREVHCPILQDDALKNMNKLSISEEAFKVTQVNSKTIKLSSINFLNNQTINFGINKIVTNSLEIFPISKSIECYGYCNALEENLFSLTLKIIGSNFGEIKWLIAIHKDSYSMEVKTYGEQCIEKYRGIYNGKLK